MSESKQQQQQNTSAALCESFINYLLWCLMNHIFISICINHLQHKYVSKYQLPRCVRGISVGIKTGCIPFMSCIGAHHEPNLSKAREQADNKVQCVPGWWKKTNQIIILQSDYMYVSFSFSFIMQLFYVHVCELHLGGLIILCSQTKLDVPPYFKVPAKNMLQRGRCCCAIWQKCDDFD